jgi:hypothetical protein
LGPRIHQCRERANLKKSFVFSARIGRVAENTSNLRHRMAEFAKVSR